MSKRFEIAAGVRTKVYRLFSSSVPSTITFTAEASQEGALAGTIEVARWHWFSWRHETHPLRARNVISKGFADADFVVHVTPECDCTVTLEGKGANGALVLVIAIVAIAAAMMLLTAPPPGG